MEQPAPSGGLSVCHAAQGLRKGFASAASLGGRRWWLELGLPGRHAAPLRSRDWFCLAAAGKAGGGHW